MKCTGRVPFNGETTVAIAIKHIQEEMPSPKEFVPEIPDSVEGIVLKCCQKSPDRRYQNMQEVIGDLKQSLMYPDENFVVQNDPDLEGGTRTITPSDMEQIKRRTTYKENYEYEEHEEHVEQKENKEMMRLRSDVDEFYEDETEEGDDYDYNPKMERVTTFLALIGGVVICVIVIVLVINVFDAQGSNVNSDNSSGPIITSEPTAGPSVSDEANYVKMPALKDKSVEDARNELTNW